MTSCTGASGTNYAISYVPGTVKVTPLPLVITASSSTVTYGTTPTVTASYTLPVGGSPFGGPDVFDHGHICERCRLVSLVVHGCGGHELHDQLRSRNGEDHPGDDSAHGNFVQLDLPAGNDPAESYLHGDRLRREQQDVVDAADLFDDSVAETSPGTYPTSCSEQASDTNYSGINYVPGTDTETSRSHPIALAGKTAVKKASAKPQSPTTTTISPTPVAGATTVHTGEPWGGSGPWVLAAAGVGLAIMALGGELLRRRRHS